MLTFINGNSRVRGEFWNSENPCGSVTLSLRATGNVTEHQRVLSASLKQVSSNLTGSEHLKSLQENIPKGALTRLKYTVQ